MTDADLVARARAGDADAFDALARRHYRTAFAVAFAVTGNRQDAEDVCHDALLRVLERLDECREPARFAAWLLTIVRNHARNRLDYERVRDAAPIADSVPSGPATDLRVERLELRRRLETAMAGLSPVQREIVMLHDLHDWSHARIAGHLGCSELMSRQHLFRARRTLRAALGLNLLKEQFGG